MAHQADLEKTKGHECCQLFHLKTLRIQKEEIPKKNSWHCDANQEHTNGVVGLVEVRRLRIVSRSSLVDSANSVLVLIVLHQAGDFLSGVSDGALHHLDRKYMMLKYASY